VISLGAGLADGRLLITMLTSSVDEERNTCPDS
jgi:hypothetical protein